MQFFEDGYLPTINTTFSFFGGHAKPSSPAGAGQLNTTQPLKSCISWMARKEPLPNQQKKSLKPAK